MTASVTVPNCQRRLAAKLKFALQNHQHECHAQQGADQAGAAALL